MQVDETGHEIEIEEIYQTVYGEKKLSGYIARCAKCGAESSSHMNCAMLDECLDGATRELSMFPCIKGEKIKPTEKCEYCNSEKKLHENPLYVWYIGRQRRFTIDDGMMKIVDEGISQPEPPWFTTMKFAINYCPICGREL